MADLLMMFKSWVLIINAWENGPFLGMLGILSIVQWPALYEYNKENFDILVFN